MNSALNLQNSTGSWKFFSSNFIWKKKLPLHTLFFSLLFHLLWTTFFHQITNPQQKKKQRENSFWCRTEKQLWKKQHPLRHSWCPTKRKLTYELPVRKEKSEFAYFFSKHLLHPFFFWSRLQKKTGQHL